MNGKGKGHKALLALAALLVLVAFALSASITIEVAADLLGRQGDFSADWRAGVATGATPWLWWFTLRNFIRVRRVLRKEARLLP